VREALEFLLHENLTLRVDDVLEMLPSSTKMRDLKPFLSIGLQTSMEEINQCQSLIKKQSGQVSKLQKQQG